MTLEELKPEIKPYTVMVRESNPENHYMWHYNTPQHEKFNIFLTNPPDYTNGHLVDLTEEEQKADDWKIIAKMTKVND